MTTRSPKEITRLLVAWGDGDETALEKLTPLVYQQLHRLAHHYLSHERSGHGDYENNDLVFCTSIGTPLQPRNVIGRHLKPILCKAFCDGPHETGPHKVDIRWYDLRHTTASLLLRSGTNPKIVAERLGHASVNLTLNVHSHTIPSMQHEAAVDLEKVLCG